MAQKTSTRSELYRAARDLGNLQAAAKGPSAYSKRVVRRAVLRKTNTSTLRAMKKLGI